MLPVMRVQEMLWVGGRDVVQHERQVWPQHMGWGWKCGGFFSSLLLRLLQEREANKGNNCSLWPLQRPLAVEADLCLGSACFGARTDGEKNAMKGSVPITVLFLPPLCMSALKTSEKKRFHHKKKKGFCQHRNLSQECVQCSENFSREGLE